MMLIKRSYEDMIREFADADRTMILAYLDEKLPALWREEYLAMPGATCNLVTISFGAESRATSFCRYLFDHASEGRALAQHPADGTAEDRVAAVWGLRLRNLVVLWFVCVHTLLGLAMSANAQDADLYPPLVPAGERVAPDSSEFVASCLSIVKDRLTTEVLVTHLVTENDRWGTILRIDYAVPGFEPKGKVNRIMCWRGAAGGLGIMFAIAQAVPPLQSPT